MEQNVKDLEKTLDLDSCEQVTFKLPQKIGEGTSAAAATPLSQAPSSSTTGTTKGKEPMDTEQMTTELPTTSMGQSQEQAPPQQTEAPQIPVLQTPAHEERGRKHDREDSTPASGSTQQPESKSKKLILHLRRKSVKRSLEAQGEIEKEANQRLPALSSKSQTDSMPWRCLPPHNEARNQPASKPASKRSKLKMSY